MEKILISFLSESNIFPSFLDFVDFSISVFSGFLSEQFDQVMGIVVYRCRCR